MSSAVSSPATPGSRSLGLTPDPAEGRSFSVHSVDIDGDLIAVGLIDSTYPYVGTAAVYSRNQERIEYLGTRDHVSRTMLHHIPISGDRWRLVGIRSSSAPWVITEAVPTKGPPMCSSATGGGSNQWGETAKLRAADAAGWQYFGSSVAIDDNTIAVGAPRGSSTNRALEPYISLSVTQAGQAPWRQSARLAASDGS